MIEEILATYFWLICWNDKEIFESQQSIDRFVLSISMTIDSLDKKTHSSLFYIAFSVLFKISTSDLKRLIFRTKFEKWDLLRYKAFLSGNTPSRPCIQSFPRLSHIFRNRKIHSPWSRDQWEGDHSHNSKPFARVPSNRKRALQNSFHLHEFERVQATRSHFQAFLQVCSDLLGIGAKNFNYKLERKWCLENSCIGQ